MALNRRLLFWLIKAYVKKWRKTFFLFFLLGLGCFFLIKFFISTIIIKFPLIEKETIGLVGAYTIDSLPSYVLQDLSRGLTKIDDSGIPRTDLASSWEIKDNGKTYIFHIKKKVTFIDGTILSSTDIHFAFSDVKISRPDSGTIIFQLKEPYAPFLANMSRPIFKDGFVGIGKYRVTEVKQNGTFIASLSVVNADELYKVRIYQFYPTQESLKLAFILGNITKAVGLSDVSFQDTSLAKFPNARVTKETNYKQLVTLFYNTSDRTLNDKRLRDAFSYMLPDSFSYGQRAYSPIPSNSWAYDPAAVRIQDIDHAKTFLKAITVDTKSALPTIVISTLPLYKITAQDIVSAWKAAGIHAKIKILSSLPDPSSPDSYEVFLGNFNVPKDPDEYPLWHSDQQNNITNYKSLRIDKLLEDGRKTLDTTERIKIYKQFQKYLIDDQPASFLYFPYSYTVERK